MSRCHFAEAVARARRELLTQRNGSLFFNCTPRMWLGGRPNDAVIRCALGIFFRLGLIGAAAVATQARLLAAGAIAETAATAAHEQGVRIWTVPEVGALPRDASGLQIRKGRDLITATYAYIGPDVADGSNRYAGNNLACSNCHLEAGTKKFGLPLFGLYSDFPQYSARSGGEISIEDRVNFCMRRSMKRPGAADQRSGDASYRCGYQVYQ